MNKTNESVIFQTAPPREAATHPLGQLWQDEELREWPPLEWPAEPIRPKPATATAVWELRLLALLGVAMLAMFFTWLLGLERRGDSWLYWLFVATVFYKALWWLVEWLNYIRPKFSESVPPKRTWTVDVMTTACPGEPLGMILRTLLAMKAIRYPHTDYLCDEGNDPQLRAICAALGIRHVTREVKKNAKAGNINNALQQATGEIVVIIDPDHEPAPYMIDRVIGLFEDPGIGFVQSVQAYRNQKDGFVADGAAKQTYLFYGPVMIGMNAYGTTQAIGANCVFRRAALDSIGGHAAGLAEDMHTTIQLYAKGWRSIYLPEILTRGLVPSTLDAYCKQQLKWACGSIDLLLRIMPKLFRKMTFWQRLHYSMGPLYFLRGFIDAINITVPIVSLIIGGVVLRIDLIGYLTMFVPLQIVATVIRQRTQHWTIERSERGAHIIGGLLGAGCWWVFLRGAICGIFKVKLPYIPTPKDNDAQDCWGLAMPNLIVAGVSVAAAVYGLWRDWTPFSAMMAAFALWNAALLTGVAMIGQRRTMQRLGFALCRHDWVGMLWHPLERLRFHVHAAVLAVMRERSTTVTAAVVCAATMLHFWPGGLPEPGPRKVKDTGGFYLGVTSATRASEGVAAEFAAMRDRLGADMQLYPITIEWAAEEAAPVPWRLIREARQHGAVPLITWEPRASTFPKLRGEPQLGQDRALLAGIRDHYFDDYLRSFAEAARQFAEPMLIRFAPFPDQLSVAWSVEKGNTAEDYTDAWRQIVSVFKEAGAANVGWVWQPGSPAAFDSFYPGDSIIDWVGLSLENRGAIGGWTWQEFAMLYEPYRARVRDLRLPVLLTEFNCGASGGNRSEWVRRAMKFIAGECPEIRGMLTSRNPRGWFQDRAGEFSAALAEALHEPAFRSPPSIVSPAEPVLWAERPREKVRSGAIAGRPGAWKLQEGGEDFYIHGVAYNPGHDWRDGTIPLSRRELETDLARVKEFGANTIRRYGHSWYDRNILSVSREQGLEVLYGFWFEHEVDYIKQEHKLREYAATIEDRVQAFKDEPAVLAWSLGNEVWGSLKHHFAQPYLTEVRHAQIDFVERMVRRVRELDPERPIFAAHEHSRELSGALSDYDRGAPSLDFTAVNSYYERQISILHKVAARFDPSRPYLVSEFGPDGYWETDVMKKTDFGAVLEPSTPEKVASYLRGWTQHTVPHRGANLGGVAYCWRDRLESTATWFGLNDDDGRLKPAGLALQKLWTGRAPAPAPRIAAIKGLPSRGEPGEKLAVRAIGESVTGQSLKYRWRIASERFDFKVGEIETSGDGAEARVTLPKRPGNYRVYLSVSDGRSTDEANFPLHVAPDTTLAGKPAVLPLEGMRVGVVAP